MKSRLEPPQIRHLWGTLFRAYAAEKAPEEWHGEWGAALLYRPLAILIAPLLLRLRVRASSVTILSLLAALGLPAVAHWAGWAPLALTAMLVAVLDCLDGTIARASAGVSRAGHYLDFTTDIVFRASFYAAIGLLARTQGPAWLAAWALPASLAAALLAIAARLCRVYAEQMSGAAPYGRPARPGAAAWIFSALSGADSLSPLLVLGAGACGALGWLVLWLLCYSALDFLYTQAAILRRLA